jgi:glutamine amidotransferase
MITIANFGVGNLASIANMMNFLEIDVEVLDSPNEIENITHLIIPGVGAFDTGMELLKKTGWQSAILDLTPDTKILGICLGMHLLTNGSDEGDLEGLGLINAWSRKFDSDQVRIPHMGWNLVNIGKLNPLVTMDEKEKRYYFTHSYFVELQDFSDEVGTTQYQGGFTSIFQRNNIFGCQFHPEKSHHFGMELLKNFAAI